MWHKSVIVDEKRSLSLRLTEWSRRGVPCVMLHGLADASCVWNHLAVRIGPRFHVAAMDLRGHGDSDWDPEVRYDSKTFIADLCKAVAAFGFERLVLIGHSLGADVAIRFAAANASRVAALVIVDFGPELNKAGIDEILRSFASTPRSFASPQAYTEWLIERRPLADAILLRQFARQTTRQTLSGDWTIKADAAIATHSQISRFVPNSDRYLDPDLWPMLESVKCPSLVLRGSGSGVFPAEVANRMVERALLDGRLATIAAAGHAVMMDNPAEFSAGVVAFLSGISK